MRGKNARPSTSCPPQVGEDAVNPGHPGLLEVPRGKPRRLVAPLTGAQHPFVLTHNQRSQDNL